MDDGLNVAKIVCVSIYFSFFCIALVHSVILCLTRKKAKFLTNIPDESLENIEGHMSEAEIEEEFYQYNCFSCGRTYSIYSHLGIVATIGLLLLNNYSNATALQSNGSLTYKVNVFCIFSWIFFLIVISFEIMLMNWR